MGKKDWKNVGKLCKFDYRWGKRFLVFLILILLGICCSLLAGFHLAYMDIEDGDNYNFYENMMIIFYFAGIVIGISACIIYLFPHKTRKEIFAETGGYTVLDIECSFKNKNRVQYGSGILIKKGLAITNARIILDDNGNVSDKIDCHFLAKGCMGRVARKAIVEKYDVDLDIALLRIIPHAKERIYSAIKCSTIVSLKTGDTIYAVGNFDGNGSTILQGTVSFPLISEMHHEQKNYFIQIIIPTISGENGGAILNKKGRLVGMIVYNNKKNPSFTYAIPVDRILEYIE